MANTSAIWQQAAHTTYQVLSPSCSRAIQKRQKNVWAFFGEKSQGNGLLAEKWQDRKSKKTILHRNASNNIDRKEESNEIGKRNQMTAMRFSRQGWDRHPWHLCRVVPS